MPVQEIDVHWKNSIASSSECGYLKTLSPKLLGEGYNTVEELLEAVETELAIDELLERADELYYNELEAPMAA